MNGYRGGLAPLLASVVFIFLLAVSAPVAGGDDDFSSAPATPAAGGDDFGGGSAAAAPAEKGVTVGGHTYIQFKLNQNGNSSLAMHYLVLTIDYSFADWMTMNGDVGLGGTGPAWFEVDFSPLSFMSFKVGRLLVPFGILEQGMHHLYGAVPGKLFPLVWSQFGIMAYGSVQPFNLFGLNYFVYGLNSATSLKQKAMGARLELLPVNGMKAGASAYYDDHSDDMKDYEYAWSCDFEYKKWILGVRGEYSEQVNSPGLAAYTPRIGWFAEASARFIPSLEGIFRYGQYDPDAHRVNEFDLHNTVAMLRWHLPVKTDKEVFLDAEYRWMMEAKSEIDNDAFLLNLWIYF